MDWRWFSLLVNWSEAPKGGHFVAEFHLVTGECEHGAPAPHLAEFGRNRPNLAEGGEDILLETNLQNRARPQDDVSNGKP